MAASGGSFSMASFCALIHYCASSSSASNKFKPHHSAPKSTIRRLTAVSSENQAAEMTRTSFAENGKLEKRRLAEAEMSEEKQNPYLLEVEREAGIMENGRKRLKDYSEEAKDLIMSDGGPPRWFSPLECGSRLDNSPVLLFLPGIDGVGLGLIMHHQSLGQIFDIWCLHIPVKDRTSFAGLVKLVERTVRSEKCYQPNRPIYLVGESLGACLALSVAACNPDIDLVLVLANPATSFVKSQLRLLMPLLEVIPDQLRLSLRYMLSLMTGDPLRRAMDNAIKGVPLLHTVGWLSQDVVAMSSYLEVLADILPRETLLWKLEMLNSASKFANSRLHAVKAQTLILSSGRDQLLPSTEESQRLRHSLAKCDIRVFNDCGHFLFLEDGVDLATIIKGSSFYRRGKCRDYIFDYVQLTPPEFKTIYESHR